MPAMLDDPTAPAIYRVSGEPPFPVPFGPLPPEIEIRQVTLRDRTTIATLVPFSAPDQVPPKLTAYLCELLNREIEKGDTYPMMDTMALSAFGPYWFANFGAVMILGDLESRDEVLQMEEQGIDWSRECLGSFYIKPNYPGRSSHVCNAGFLVSDALRNRGVGRLMGECYLEWAPKLGYTYSVFNLVYETNVASLRIWDALGFKRVGRVKGCGNLRSYPDQLIDAIIFGRELGGEDDESFTEERFDKIRYYLKTGTYPNGSDRAEKSRLRSAATHYRLVPNANGTAADGSDDILMLKGKEVISDPHQQYEIARRTHGEAHGGINKTTASIADKYHWVRIKETVSAVIRNCNECKDPPASSAAAKREKRAPRSSEHAAARSSGARASQALAPHGQRNPHAAALAAAAAATVNSHDALGPQHDDMDLQYGHGEYAGLPVDPQIMLHHHHHDPWHEGGGGGGGGADPNNTDHTMSGGHVDDEDVSQRLREELEAEMGQSAGHAGVVGRSPFGGASGGDGGAGVDAHVVVDEDETESRLRDHLRR